MAHIEKYKAPSIAHMCEHYARSNPAVLERDNINPERSHLNQIWRASNAPDASWATVKSRIDEVEKHTGRKVRKDAVVMTDVVVTLPPNVPEEDMDLFFKSSIEFVASKVGIENLMSAHVHQDETTPHVHIPFTPIMDGKFNFKKLCPREFYQHFHSDLGDYLEKKMGYRPEVELSEERKAERVLSNVKQKDLDAARAVLVEPLETEKAILTAEIEGLEKERLELVRRLADIREAIRAAIAHLAERIGDALDVFGEPVPTIPVTIPTSELEVPQIEPQVAQIAPEPPRRARPGVPGSQIYEKQSHQQAKKEFSGHSQPQKQRTISPKKPSI